MTEDRERALDDYMKNLTPEKSAEIANSVDKRINKSLSDSDM